jgi:hypothetical protein
MGTNKTIEVVDTPFGAKLIIKTQDAKLPTAQRTKLLESLKLAVEILSVAEGELTTGRRSELQRSVLETHFKLGEPGSPRHPSVSGHEQLVLDNHARAPEPGLGGVFERGPEVGEARLGLMRAKLAEKFKILHAVLTGNLKIADAYSSTFQHELRNAKEKNDRELMELEQDAQDKEWDYNNIGGDFGAWNEAAEKVETFRRERGEKETSHATLWGRGTIGYVKPHKPFAASREKMPRLEAPQMLPEQYGSIHINFMTLLDRTDNMKAAVTLIHEASHKFIDTLDFAYVYEEEKYRHMSTDQALRNADSYAFAAASLARGKLICKEADIA